jgi:hypothetical protein
MQSRSVFLTIALTAAIPISSPSQTQGGGNSTAGFEVKSSVGTLPSPSAATLAAQFDLNTVPAKAREQLLPLYQREYALLEDLNVTKWQALGDVLGGLATAGAAAFATPTTASRVAEDSAALAEQYKARFRGADAAQSEQEPAEMPESVKHGMKLLNQINDVEAEISIVQKSYGLDPAARSPWSQFAPRRLTPKEVIALLTPAAKEAAKSVIPPQAPAKESRQACWNRVQSCSSACLSLTGSAFNNCIFSCPRIEVCDGLK